MFVNFLENTIHLKFFSHLRWIIIDVLTSAISDQIVKAKNFYPRFGNLYHAYSYPLQTKNTTNTFDIHKSQNTPGKIWVGCIICFPPSIQKPEPCPYILGVA